MTLRYVVVIRFGRSYGWSVGRLLSRSLFLLCVVSRWIAYDVSDGVFSSIHNWMKQHKACATVFCVLKSDVPWTFILFCFTHCCGTYITSVCNFIIREVAQRRLCDGDHPLSLSRWLGMSRMGNFPRSGSILQGLYLEENSREKLPRVQFARGRTMGFFSFTPSDTQRHPNTLTKISKRRLEPDIWTTAAYHDVIRQIARWQGRHQPDDNGDDSYHWFNCCIISSSY